MNRETEAIAGSDKGKVIFNITPVLDNPSTKPASSSSCGIV